MPSGCLTDSDKALLIEQVLSGEVDDDTERAVTIITDLISCETIPVAQAPPVELPPQPEPKPGPKGYKSDRHRFLSVCMRGPQKGGCGMTMKQCSDLWKEGKREKPC